MNEPFLEEKDEEPEQRAAREKEYEEQCKPALAFIEEAGQYVRERLAVQYKKDKHTNYLSGDQVDGLVSSIPDLNQIDLINPHIYDQLRQKTKELFNAIEDKEDKRKIIADWKTQAGAAMGFITTVENWLYQDSPYREPLQLLTPDEVEAIRSSITHIEDHELDPTFSNAEVSALTAEADRALLDNPNLNFLSKQNALTVVAEEYTVEKGYRDVLKKLLGMVSASAVAKAVSEDKDNNALMLAAAHQNAENFMALVNKLFETPEGQKKLLSTMALATQDGNNLFMLVAKYQITGGFKAFVNKVLAMEGGPEALRQSMSQMDKGHKNALMLMMQFQTSGEGVAFITKLSRIENEPATIIKSFEQSIQFKTTWFSRCNENALMTAARFLAREDFIALLNILSNTEAGKNVLTHLMKHKPNEMDVLAITAIHQRSGGFGALMDTVGELKDADEILQKSSQLPNNLAICVSDYQTLAGFITYIDKLLRIEGGPTILSDLVVNSDFFHSVLNNQRNGGLILLMSALWETEKGQKAFRQEIEKNRSGMDLLNEGSSYAHRFAATHQDTTSFILFMQHFFEVLKEEPKVLQKLLTEKWRGGDIVYSGDRVNIFSQTALSQTDEGFVALIDMILGMKNGSTMLLKLIYESTDDNIPKKMLYSDSDDALEYRKAHFRHYQNDHLEFVARNQTGNGFIALIDRLLKIEGGPEMILKSLPRLYFTSVNYQTPENLIAFVDKVLNIKLISRDIKIAILRDWSSPIVQMGSANAIIGFIRVLQQHDFKSLMDVSNFTSIIEKRSSAESYYSRRPTILNAHTRKALIEFAKNPAAFQDKTPAEILGGEMRAPQESPAPEVKEVKFHLPPETKEPIVEGAEGEDVAVQSALLEHFFLNKPQQPVAAMPAVAPDEAEFKKSLQPFIEKLQDALKDATHDLGIIQTVLNHVRRVHDEAKPGEKQAEVHSLFTLREKIVTKEKPFETFPLVVQHVLSSIEKFRESSEAPAPVKGKPLLPT